MKQKLFEQNGGTYSQQGDYFLPNMKLPDQSEFEIGVCGSCRRQYLKQHHRIKYYNMLTQCTLYPHLQMSSSRRRRYLTAWLISLQEKMSQKSSRLKINAMDSADEQYPQQDYENRQRRIDLRIMII